MLIFNYSTVAYARDDGKTGGITIVKSMLEAVLLEGVTDGQVCSNLKIITLKRCTNV